MPRRRAYRAALLLLLLPAHPALRAQAPRAAQREPDFTVVVDKNVMIPMRDGVRLAADLYRPAKDGRAVDGRFPTLLTRTPYGKGTGESAEGKYYALRGYNVVINDVRGRYGSEGTWRLLVDDPQDGYDVVEWIAAQPWSDGKVGTFGTSYPGGTQHALAETNPPHLTTLVPIDSVANCGVAGMRHGGAFELRFMNWIYNTGAPNSRAALANPALRTALQENGLRVREHADCLPLRPTDSPLRAVPEYESWLVQALRSGPESPFWKVKGLSVVDHVAEYADVPVLHVTGWYDSWSRQVAMNYEALSKAKKSRHRLIIGPWTHGMQGSSLAGEVEFTPDAAIDLLGMRLRWYDHWMRGVQNGVEDDAPVLIYVMGTGDDRKSPRDRLMHGGSWRAEKQWPPARTRPTPLYFHADGILRRGAPTEADSQTTFTFDPRHPVPTVGGNLSSNVPLIAGVGGMDQRERGEWRTNERRLPLSERRDVLVFRTPPLESDVEVTGTVLVHLWVASTARDTDFTAKLIDEIPPNKDYPLGFDLNLGDSILRARYRKSLERPELLEPGRVEPLTIRLYPTSNVFKKGHRLRVDVSSSNYPRFDVNPNTGEPLGTSRRTVLADNTVYHDENHPSHVVLPVIGPDEH